MPQDSLRSIVYRSFVTCDDPKGVAECKTIRKSKSDSKKMENKTKNQRTDSNTPTSYEAERKDRVCKESTEDLQNLSSLRIMEVSRGAENLNEVVDTWSNRSSTDKQSKYMAKDLLRGALDLQESLVMLGKLQEASKCITKSKKRHKDVGIKFVDSESFVDDNTVMEFQKPRISGDGASRDCYDELREVIKESFARHNLLPKVSAKEKDFLDRKNSELCVDFPSSSSSQSSLIYSRSSNCSPSSIQHEKPKGSNLIAKLMGLEEMSSKAATSITFKQVEKEKLSNCRSYLFDIDLPRPKKPQFTVQDVVRDRRTLEEMIETLQFKGLLEREFIDESNNGKRHSGVSFLTKSLAVECPPIVIMRPLHVPDLRSKELHENHGNNEEKHIKSRKMPQNMREKFPPSALEGPRGKCKFTEAKDKLIAGRPPKQKLNKDKEDKHSEKFPVRPIMKTLDTHDRQSTMKKNHSKPLIPKTQKKDAVFQKIDDKPKVASNARNQAEIKDTKSQVSTRTQDLGKLDTLKLNKAVRKSYVTKSQITRGKVAITDKNMKATSPKSSIPKKNLRKAKSNSKPAVALVENTQSQDGLPINFEGNIQGSLMKITETEQVTEKVMNASYIFASDNSGKAESSPCESFGATSKDGLSAIEDGSCIPCPCESSEAISEDDHSGIEDGSCVPGHYLYETKDCNSITKTKCVLLTSKSFLNHEEEVLNTVTCNPTVMQTAPSPDSEVLDDSLLLDCANEKLEYKSLSSTRTADPFSQNLYRKPKCHLSIEDLAGQISDETGYLRNYSKSCGDIIHVNSIYSMLERDLWWNEEATGAWDLGWRKGYTTEAVNEVAHDIMKLFLSELIADLVIEMPK